MKVLIACEFSGVVREAFRKLGHDAWSCDLEGAWDRSPYHYQGDVATVLNDGWDLMIAHPPCTFLANSGIRWITATPKKRNPKSKYGADRIKAIEESVKFFKTLLDSPIPRIAVENPAMHHFAIDLLPRKYDQTIHPYMFGGNEVKTTHLWLKNLNPLKPTKVSTERFPGTHLRGWERFDYEKRSRKMAQKLRSITFQGIADAMANQWGAV